jgi:hypothetical protein
MQPDEIPERTRRQLAKLPPGKRAKAQAALARTRTPEFRAQVSADRAALDHEYHETGRILTIGNTADAMGKRRFILDLRRERGAQG